VTHLFDLFLQMSRVKVQPWALGKAVELSVEHSDDLGALIVDNGLQLLAPEYGDAVTPCLITIRT
jgi:hypothetical protein